MIDLRPLLPALFPIPLWFFSILVGLWNTRRGNSFWVGFLLSLFFTPIGGAFLIATTTTARAKIPKESKSPEVVAIGQGIDRLTENYALATERYARAEPVGDLKRVIEQTADCEY